MKVKRFARVMALSLSLALAVPSVVPGAALTAEAASKKVSLVKGETKKLTVSTDKKVTWKSSKKSVATVNKNGKVTAKKKGTTTITATYGSSKKTWKVEVSSISLNKKKATLNIVDPTTTDTTYVELRVRGLDEAQQAEVTWSSSDTSLVTVTPDRSLSNVSATVRPATTGKTGTATVTAKYGKIKMTCVVTVTKSGNNKDVDVYPKVAMTVNQKDNTAAGGAWPLENGSWNDVTLQPVQASFVSYIDARASKLGVGAQMNYTYHLVINGKAQGKIVDTTGLSNLPAGQKRPDGTTVQPYVYYTGTSYVKVGLKLKLDNNNGRERFYWAVDPQNERGYWEQYGYAMDGYGIGWFDPQTTASGVGAKNEILLKCKEDGTFAFDKAIYTTEPLERIEVTTVWPVKRGDENDPFENPIVKGTTGTPSYDPVLGINVQYVGI